MGALSFPHRITPKDGSGKKAQNRNRELAEGNCEILGQFEMLAVLERFTC